MGNHASCRPRDKKTNNRGFKSRSVCMAEEDHQDIHVLLSRGRAKTYSQSYSWSTSAKALPSKQARCSSARPRLDGDALLYPQQTLIDENKNLASHKFILVHGGGFGAWCWYKSMALLEEAGCAVVAVDLSASGIDIRSSNQIGSLGEYVKPLLDYLEKLPSHEKVNLVGHSFGGACISYAMERYPNKIAKAIFVAATMVKDGQSAFDVFSSEANHSRELVRNALVFAYANGSDVKPTSIQLDKDHVKKLFFNRSSSKDVALALLSIRLVPFAPFMEKLILTQENYGSVSRFFIQTTDDRILSTQVQEYMVDMNPPEQVLKVQGSDHCPFFSKPQSLHAVFMGVAQLNAKKQANVS